MQRQFVSPRGRLSDGKPNPVDVHVGQRLRLRRVMVGMSQEQVADAIGVTFQQVQKYERGGNRISASRLWDISVVLNCPVSFFFKEMDADVAEASPRNLAQGATAPEIAPMVDGIAERWKLTTIRAMEGLSEPERASVLALVQALLSTHRQAAE